MRKNRRIKEGKCGKRPLVKDGGGLQSFCSCDEHGNQGSANSVPKMMTPTTSSDGSTCDRCGYYCFWERGKIRSEEDAERTFKVAEPEGYPVHFGKPRGMM